ncbi:efflux RND transporter periplasmic adaptor subunit [Marinobacter mobilis]|uniref:Membrane fusion protein, multidrug efflux system n=1 Tax=Marinobacter mobilis TaxID=488533 RepID=A0A1H2SQC7_9GAMM|nr:efflux RND transporter periplasmic adaptor subunit [Marinobacter mobilis]SDW33812.1 membrane fusion protein, multidrug efflux system [Marinobacter mobilis]
MRHLALPLSLFTVLLLAGCGQTDAPANEAQVAPEVGYITVEARPFTLVNELPGRTAPYQVAEVRPQVTGLLVKRLFQEGEAVVTGQPLYQIDDRLYKAALASAQAELASARASLETARLKAERYERLINTGAISQQDLDQARATLHESEALVDAARAAVQTATINLEYTTITAPIAGRIGRSSVTAGALVTANQASALVTIRQLDPIYVDVTQSYNDLQELRSAMAAGQLQTVGEDQAAATLVYQSGESYGHSGTLQFSEFAVDETTGSVTLRALFPNPDDALLPGMFVRARLPQAERESAILVPQKGISRDPDGQAAALVISDEGTVEKRRVIAERVVESQWLIREGLANGDRLIVEGLQKIRVGIPVRAVNVGTPEVSASSSLVAEG